MHARTHGNARGAAPQRSAPHTTLEAPVFERFDVVCVQFEDLQRREAAQIERGDRRNAIVAEL